MRSHAARNDVFSADEIARAAGVPVRLVTAILARGGSPAPEGVPRSSAIRLVRYLTSAQGRAPLTLVAPKRRRSGLPLAASIVLHGLLVLLIAFATLHGLLSPNDQPRLIKDATPAHLVYLMTPGPGGGGGGGGLAMPAPPPPAARKAPAPRPKKISSPVPPVRKTPAPVPVPRVIVPAPPPPVHIVAAERPIEIPKPPPPAPAVQAPVTPAPADAVDRAGALEASASAAPSAGPGTGGGTGSGTGTGLGSGDGAGIGPGSGGGTGGGPFHPGDGIEPPSLLREIKPNYTDDARRRAIEGDVQLDVVVRRDGSVGDCRVTSGLGAGLDQKAIDAVRQWKFAPARRAGAPVDVVVQVAVEFKLR